MNRTAPAPNNDPNTPLTPRSHYFDAAEMHTRRPAAAPAPLRRRFEEPPLQVPYVARRTGRNEFTWNAPARPGRVVGEALVEEFNRPSMRIEDVALGSAEAFSGLPHAEGRPRADGYTMDSRGVPTGVRLGLIMWGRDFRRRDSEIANDVASVTGVDGGFLYRLAQRESGWDMDAQAQTSSATGLTQFVDSTWRTYTRAHGARYGLPATMQDEEVLQLRKDPRWNLAMASELTRENAVTLRSALGRDPTEGELYLMHFGGGAGLRLAQARQADPNGNPRNIFSRQQIDANQGIFWDMRGRHARLRTNKEVFERLTVGFEDRAVAIGPRRDGSN